MNKRNNHIAFIPARKGSKGFPGKNSKLFVFTANFIKKSKLFDRVIVSTNDEAVKRKATISNFEIHNRKNKYSTSTSSIKSSILSAINELNINENDIIWLFYIPIIYKDLVDFKKAKKIISKKNVNSLLSFVKDNIHPYHFWKFDRNKKTIKQYFKNNIYRRQDLPAAFRYYHYLCCFKVKEVKNLNEELINNKTFPLILDLKTSDKLIEVDTHIDYIKWKKFYEIK
ncbi:MAG: hypothetical protein CMF96_10875 [Candidatus Marinimicrobia bacterium]|nr:hypothetical protein [Candidatus Neomarinimicrobiota bacterium]OUV97232.1 MAG: hypothetical protein CBD02_03710 [Candidatus Pelagibacter sp. TMED142]